MSRSLSSMIAGRRVGSPQRKAVLLYLADRATDGGLCGRVSKDEIAAETEFSRSTIFKTFSELVSKGLIAETPEESATRILVDAVLALPCLGAESARRTSERAPHDIPTGQPETLTAAPERADTEGPQVDETAAIEGPDDGGNSPAAQEAPVAGGAVHFTHDYGAPVIRDVGGEGVAKVTFPFTEVAVPVPVSPEMIPTLVDAEHSRMRRMAEDIATPIHGAPAAPAPKRYMPPSFPPGDVGRVLLAAGVDPLARGALYWWRRDHKADLADLLKATGLTVEQIERHLIESGIKHPDIARLTALQDSLMGARG